ncbi:Protein of unknown function [Cotesia congregata]|uniref:Uncharacterized protein n=1 Tax=Cotesia congregata TaxID=51543 RepID=A0A8J2HNT0_COTCN|nr:Protein of unknown function [Cotesia congregata]
MGCISPPPPTIRFNYKKTNWRKFGEKLLDIHQDFLPADRNLTINEINHDILKLKGEITDTINTIVPKMENDGRKGCLKYKFKSNLIADKFKQTDLDEQARIKQLIKVVNKKLTTEFQKSETAYWVAKAKSINYKENSKFFGRINRYYKYKEPPRIVKLAHTQK